MMPEDALVLLFAAAVGIKGDIRGGDGVLAQKKPCFDKNRW